MGTMTVPGDRSPARGGRSSPKPPGPGGPGTPSREVERESIWKSSTSNPAGASWTSNGSHSMSTQQINDLLQPRRE